MTPEMRYLLDLNGYLHLRSVLSSRELSACRAAADRHVALCAAVSSGDATAAIPEGFGNGAKPGQPGGKGYDNGYAWEKPLEQLVFHRSIWPIVLELTGGKPALSTGTMIVDDMALGPAHQEGSGLHCAREDVARLTAGGPSNTAPFEGACFCEERDGKVRSDNFVVFPYLDSVGEGDGGLIVLPGSHKSKFNRPGHLFGPFGIDAYKRQQEEKQKNGGSAWGGVPAVAPAVDASPELGVHPLVANLTPQAGDILIMPEATTHGVLPWRGAGRRRIFSLRFRVQHGLREYRAKKGQLKIADFPGYMREHWSEETLELLLGAEEGHTKEIARREVIELASWDELYPPLPTTTTTTAQAGEAAGL